MTRHDASAFLRLGPERLALRLGAEASRDADGAARHVVQPASHLHGPRGVLQGGLAAGLLAEVARHGCERHRAPLTMFEARLHAPTPLAQELTATCREVAAGHFEAATYHGDTPLVTGHVEIAGHDIVPHVGDLAALARVALPEPTPQMSFPDCVVCGPDNPEGLHLLPGWHTDTAVVTPFLPEEDLADDHGRLDPLVVAAVLDCPTVWASLTAIRANGHAGALLAVYHLRVFVDAPVMEPLRTVAIHESADGRKIRARSALIDEDGVVYAMARALHVSVPTLPDFTSDPVPGEPA